MKYTIQHFINKFSRIPEDKWIIGQYFDETGNACCALGHCGVREAMVLGLATEAGTEESKALSDIFHEHNLLVACVNDNKNGFYHEATPKERILSKLKEFELTNIN